MTGVLPPMTSQRSDWRTPRALFDQLNEEFRFDLDGAASPENALCARYFTADDNALWQDWGGHTVWLNPPYGPPLDAFVRKAAMEATKGATVVCLLPSMTGTAWWHEVVLAQASEIRFLRGRLRFDDGPWSAPFASVLVIFRGAGATGEGEPAP